MTRKEAIKILKDSMAGRMVLYKDSIQATQMANNDGLSLDDWKDWFRHYDHTKPLAIIHFTKFRY